jgi:hypothetical protein
MIKEDPCQENPQRKILETRDAIRFLRDVKRTVKKINQSG